LPIGRDRSQRPCGDRMGRVRRARNIPREPAGRRGVQACRRPHARYLDARDPATRLGTVGREVMMRRAALTLLLGVCLSLVAAYAAWAVDPTELPDPALQARYVALTHELRCMQCQNESLADSPVDLAADLRREVRNQVLAGKSDDEIRAWMTARYGDFILFRPRYSLRNAWLWGAPGVLLLIGALVCWRIVRNRTTLLAADHEPLEEDGRS